MQEPTDQVSHSLQPKSFTEIPIGEAESDYDMTLDSEIDKILEEKAAKSNLSAFNVKSIIRQVISNDMVRKLISRKMREKDDTSIIESSLEDEDNDENGTLFFEPKLTRSKRKELLVQSKDELELWPIISPAKLQAQLNPSDEDHTLLILEDLPEESEPEDGEYVPSGDEVYDTSLSDGRSPSMSTVLRPSNSVNARSKVKRKQSCFQTNGIGLRTRSKLPMNHTPLEDLEKQLIVPDFDADMYDWNDSVNDEYMEFIKTFAFSPSPIANDDEEADPEYNAMEDVEEEEHDKEEHRVDRAVKVTKKELNELMEELCQNYIVTEDFENITALLPTPIDSLKILRTPNSKMEDSTPLNAVTSASESSTTKFPEIPPPPLASATHANPDLTPSQDNLIQPVLIHPPVIPVVPQMESTNQPSPNPVLAEASISPEESEPKQGPLLTPEILFTIRHQMQKHIQLLATTYVICSGQTQDDFQLGKAANSAKALVLEIRRSAELDEQNPVYVAQNLQPAIEIFQSWPPRAPSGSPIKKKILEEQGYKASEGFMDQSRRMLKFILGSPAFMYSSLLPMQFLPVSAPLVPFTASEDGLVARGLAELQQMQVSISQSREHRSLDNICGVLSELLLPIRSKLQIKNRIKNMKKLKQVGVAGTNCLKEFFLKEKVPCVPVDSYFPTEALPPSKHPQEYLNGSWKSIVKFDMWEAHPASASLQSSVLNRLFNNSGGRKKIRQSGVKKPKVKAVSSEAISNEALFPLESKPEVADGEFDVYCVTNDAGENLFTFTVPKLEVLKESVHQHEKNVEDYPIPIEASEIGTEQLTDSIETEESTSPPVQNQPTTSSEESFTERTAPVVEPSKPHIDLTNDDDEDETDGGERRRDKKFNYEPPSAPETADENADTTDEDIVSYPEDCNQLEEKISASSSPDQKQGDSSSPTKSYLVKKRKKNPSELTCGSAMITAKNPGLGSKRLKYNTTPIDQLLETTQDEEEELKSAFSEAYVLNVRARLESKNPSLFPAFLQFLTDCGLNGVTDEDIYSKVEEHLRDFPDLVLEFGGLLEAHKAFTTGNFIPYQETQAQKNFLQLVKKWTANCPQFKTKIMQKLKCLQDANLTEQKIFDVLQPFFSQTDNTVILDALKGLFPSIFRPHSIYSTDFEVVEMDSDDIGKQDGGPSQSVVVDIPIDHYETVQLPEEKQVIATNTCPCVCHEDSANIHYHTRARHCDRCCLRKFQDGKLFLHSGRVMKPVSIEFASPELTRQILAPPYHTLKTPRPTVSPSSLSALRRVGASVM